MLTRRKFLGKTVKTAAGLVVVSLFDDLFPEMAEAHIVNGRVEIDLSELQLKLYEDDELTKVYTVAVGQKINGRSLTPMGEFIVLNKIENPSWIPTPYHIKRNPKLKKVMDKNNGKIPYGHRLNPLRRYWVGFSETGEAIHGMHGKIGKYSSRGCVRMTEKDVVDFAKHVYVGMPVRITA